MIRNPIEPKKSSAPVVPGCGYVYAFHCAGVHKIGMSSDVAQRLAQVQRYSPSVVTIAAFRLVEEIDMRFLERRVHKILASSRLHGEWFSASLPEIRLAFKVAREALVGRQSKRFWEQRARATAIEKIAAEETAAQTELLVKKNIAKWKIAGGPHEMTRRKNKLIMNQRLADIEAAKKAA